MTTPLFLLRCVQLGLSIRDLDLLTIGLVNDMFIESRNDDYNGSGIRKLQRSLIMIYFNRMEGSDTRWLTE